MDRGPRLRNRPIAYLPAVLLIPVVLAPPLNHDVAATLDFAQRWLGGEALYSRLLDPNPPMVFVLNLLPAYIAAHTGFGAVKALQLCILLYGGLVWWLTWRMRLPGEETTIERHFLNVAPLLFFVAAGSDFGQRDHLMALGALPYFFMSARRVRGERAWLHSVIAILAAIAFALKPYFLGIPILVEVYLLFSLGWRCYLRSPVPWLMLGVWAIYLVSLPLLFPAYLTVVLPLISDYYLGGNSIWETMQVPRIWIALVLFLPLLWIAFRRGGALERIVSLGVIGAVVSALIQLKGWSYHIVPLELFGCVLAGILISRWLDRHGTEFRRYAAFTASGLTGLFALFAISGGEAPWRQFGYANAQDELALRKLLIRSAADAPVLVLSPQVWPIYPALNYAGSRQTLRAINVWLLQGIYRDCLPDGRRHRSPDAMEGAERDLFQATVEDFAADPPSVVVIDLIPGIPWCGSEFSFLDYFKQHPRFASTWSRYQLFAVLDRLVLYRRVD